MPAAEEPRARPRAGIAEWCAAPAVEERERLVPAGAEARSRRVLRALAEVSKEATSGSEFWWQTKYWICRVLADMGEYGDADFALRDLDRNCTGFDADPSHPNGKYGMKPRFEALWSDVKEHLPPRRPAPERPR